MKRSFNSRSCALVAGLLLVILSACTDPAERFDGEKYQEYFKKPNAETTEQVLSKEEIYTWKDHPNKGTFLGYLEKVEVHLEGSRTTQEIYRVYNRRHHMVAYITPNGEFYHFGEDAQPRYVGPYELQQGIKLLFNVPLVDNIHFAPIRGY